MKLIHTTETIKRKQLKEILEKEKKIDLKMCFPPASQFVDILNHLSHIFKFKFEIEDYASDDITFHLFGEEYFLDWKHLSSEEVENVSEMLYYHLGCKIEYKDGILEEGDEKKLFLSISIENDFIEKRDSSNPPVSTLQPIVFRFF